MRELVPDVVVAPGLMIGATDARSYGPICEQVIRFQPVVLEPVDFHRFHGVDERISVENLVLAVRAYARLIETGAG